MRRSDKEIKDIQEILAVIDECKVIRLAMVDDGMPYVVPLNFGYTYENGSLTFYCHSAHEGRKIDILRKNPAVAFALDCRGQLQTGSEACKHSYYYSSVLGDGTVEFLQGEEKCAGLSTLMRHMTGREDTFTAEMVERVEVIAIHVKSFSAKERKPS